MTEESEAKVIETFDEGEEGDVLEKYEISSYGADYPIDSLVARFRDGSIIVTLPHFIGHYE